MVFGAGRPCHKHRRAPGPLSESHPRSIGPVAGGRGPHAQGVIPVCADAGEHGPVGREGQPPHGPGQRGRENACLLKAEGERQGGERNNRVRLRAQRAVLASLGWSGRERTALSRDQTTKDPLGPRERGAKAGAKYGNIWPPLQDRGRSVDKILEHRFSEVRGRDVPKLGCG